MRKFLPFCVVLLAAWLASARSAPAGPRHSPDLGSLPPKPLSTAAAADELTKFRRSWFGSDIALSFDLIHRPRRGDDTTYSGQGWSTWGGQGPMTRIQVTVPAADKAAAPQVWTWLFQSGPHPRVWVLAPGAATAAEVPSAEWRKPLLPGLIYTPFDLMLPFLYWSDFKYDGTDRILERGVDVFTMNPPPAEQAAGLRPVKIYLDRELGEDGTLVRTQELDAQGKVALQFDLDKVAKVQGKWILRSCSLLDEKKDDYDLFSIQAAAIPSATAPFQFDAAVFSPEKLAQPVPAVPASAWSSL